eukprot:COSAG05_NODE_1008_length_6213_cov_13.207720_6_plen_118_part_00
MPRTTPPNLSGQLPLRHNLSCCRAFFDNPPSFNTWDEIGRYCELVTRQISRPDVAAWKADPQAGDPDVFAAADITLRLCGDEAPGAGFCDVPEENPVRLPTRTVGPVTLPNDSVWRV